MKKESHYMIDIETMGTRPNSHILSIACLKFNPMGDPEAGPRDNNAIPIVWERWDITPQSCREYGLEIDPDTVLWWFQQSEEARMDAVLGLYKKKLHLRVALLDLSSFIKKFSDGGNIYVWAKSPQFKCCPYVKLIIIFPWRR